MREDGKRIHSILYIFFRITKNVIGTFVDISEVSIQVCFKYYLG